MSFSESERPSRDDVCMAVAHQFSLRGTCSRKQVGVVIALEGRILATGYNGAPKGLPHCSHECTCEFKTDIHELKCPCHPKAATCREAIHAEVNAIAFAARYGISLENATLYTTYSPCLPCAQLIINSGIQRVRCESQYHDPDGMRLLIQAGLQVA